MHGARWACLGAWGWLAAGSALADPEHFSARNDFSTVSNPNGSWTYLAGGVPILGTVTMGAVLQGWGNYANFDTSITHVIGSPGTLEDGQLGDVAIHVASAGYPSPAAVRWTAPRTGVATISGRAWDLDILSDRDVSWSLQVNGVTVASRSTVSGTRRGDANAQFASNLAAGQSLTGVVLAAGDTVVFATQHVTSYGHFLGVDLEIDLSCPGIAQQPLSRPTCPGGNATFSAQGVGGGTVGYRWQRVDGGGNGTDLSDGQIPGSAASVSGTGTATLTIHGADPAAAAMRYRAVVTSSCGSAATDAAVLTLSCPNLADVAGLGGSAGCDGRLTADDIVYYLDRFFANDLTRADLVGLGGAGGPDARITPDDLIAFLGAYFAGCP